MTAMAKVVVLSQPEPSKSHDEILIARRAELMAEMWEPMLRRATQRGEIRSDLDVMAVGEWLAVVQFILVGRRDVTGTDDPSTRLLLKTFVLPAFMPVA